MISFVKYQTQRLIVRIKRSQSLPMIFKNISWLSFDRLLRMFLGIFVGVLLARYLGPANYGLLNYAISFTAIFAVIATMGLNNIVVKELVEAPDRTNKILGSALVMKLSAGILACLLASITVALIRPSDLSALSLVFIISLGFIFQAFDVIDLWFQAQVLSKYAVCVKSSAFLLASLTKIMLIMNGAPLVAFAVVATFEIFVVMIGLLLVYRVRTAGRIGWEFDPMLARRLISLSWPLVLSGVSLYVYSKIDQVMLGQMVDFKTVGIYAVAVRISEFFDFLPLAIFSSVLPRFVSFWGRSRDLFFLNMQKLSDVMVVVWLLLSIFVSIFANLIIVLLYGQDYLYAGFILSIYIWGQIGTYFGLARGIYITANNLFRLSLVMSISGAILNIILNFYLIPLFGILGATLATLITYMFVSIIINFIIPDLRKMGFVLIRSLFIPGTIYRLAFGYKNGQ